MATALPLTTRSQLPNRRVATAATGESATVRWTLIGVAVFFLALFIFLPLAIVFSQAFAKGIGVYWASLHTPDALAAIRLTLLAAGIAVPLNLVFGVAAAWAIGKFEFVGKSGVKHRKVLVDNELAALLSELKELGTSRKLFHYHDAEGKPRAVPQP